MNQTAHSPAAEPDPEGLDRLARVLEARRRDDPCLLAQMCASVVSLDALRTDAGFDLPDPNADPEHDALALDEAQFVRALVNVLPQPQADVVRWRYGLDGPEMSLRDIGLALSVSESTASRLERQGLTWLRQAQGLRPAAERMACGRLGRATECARATKPACR